MSPRPQGELTVERMCVLAGVSRAGYYRHLRVSLPRQEETVVRDAIQRVSLAKRRYGYRRIAAQLRRDGLVVNHKRVLRLMRQDNLLCLRRRPFVPVTSNLRHEWRVVANLAQRSCRPLPPQRRWRPRCPARSGHGLDRSDHQVFECEVGVKDDCVAAGR